MSGHDANVEQRYNMTREAFKAIPNELSTAPGPSHEGPTLSRHTPFFLKCQPGVQSQTKAASQHLGPTPFRVSKERLGGGHN